MQCLPPPHFLALVAFTLILGNCRPAVAVFNLTVVHDTDTRGGVFEYDGDGKECVIDVNSTIPRVTDVGNQNATRCAGGGSFRHTFFQNLNKTYTNPIVFSKTKLFFGSSLYTALSSITNTTTAAAHVAKHYTTPCHYDALSIDNSEFFSGPTAFGAFVNSLPQSIAVVDTYIDINVANNSGFDTVETAKQVQSKVAKYKIINRTGVSIAIMASADFEINIKSVFLRQRSLSNK